MGCPAPKRCTGRFGFSPIFDDITTSTSSENLYCSIRGTTPPTGCTSTSMEAILLAHSVLRLLYTDPCTTPLIIMSPFMDTASAVLSRVTSTAFLVFSSLHEGSVNMSRTVPMSVPMAFWNSTISLLVTSTSPYIWLWNVPESVIITPS